MMVNVKDSFFLAIDLQQYLLPAMFNGDIAVKYTGILLQAAGALNVPIAVTEQYPKGLGKTVGILQRHISSTNKYEKTCFSCTDVGSFMTFLHASHRRQVVLTGMEAHICVLQTALALLAQGFQVFVVEDAVCSRTQQNKDNAMRRLQQAGVIITNAEAVLFECLADAKHPEFRTLSKLIV